MPIKNTLKIFASKFSMVYAILLYLSIMLVIIACVSVFVVIPVQNFLVEEGIAERITDILTKLVVNGYSGQLVDQITECFFYIRDVLSNNVQIIIIGATYLILVLGILFRFLVGMMELPVLKKLQGAMSDNAQYGFMGMFVSMFADSLLYSVMKIVVKFVVDVVVYVAMYFISVALFNTSARIITPFVVCFALVGYYAFKGGITACWGASIAVDGRSVFGSFKYSVKTFFKDFPKLFGTYVVMLFLLLCINFFIARYTFGAGIVISLPVSIFLVYVFNMTYFYTKRGYRYYVGEEIAGGEEVKH